MLSTMRSRRPNIFFTVRFPPLRRVVEENRVVATSAESAR
jgi:hypothetical protein